MLCACTTGADTEGKGPGRDPDPGAAPASSSSAPLKQEDGHSTYPGSLPGGAPVPREGPPNPGAQPRGWLVPSLSEVTGPGPPFLSLLTRLPHMQAWPPCTGPWPGGGLQKPYLSLLSSLCLLSSCSNSSEASTIPLSVWLSCAERSRQGCGWALGRPACRQLPLRPAPLLPGHSSCV